MNIAAKTLFDVDLHDQADEIGEAINQAFHEYNVQISSVIRRLLSLLPVSVRLPGDARLNEAVQRLDRLIYGIIARRRAAAGDRGDLLSMLMQAQDDNGTRMTDHQLRDEIMTLFLAGHETTANTLTWTCFLLAQHPEAETKLLAELQHVLGGEPPRVNQIPQLVYTQYVIKEAMRLYPPVWFISRESTTDYEIGGFHIPPGSEIGMSQWLMHRSERYFPEPLAFRPERWQDQLEKRLPKYVYFPFGGGPRICIGNSFAEMEATLLLATMAQRFHFALAPEHPVVPEPSITLRPKHGVRLRLKAR